MTVHYAELQVTTKHEFTLLGLSVTGGHGRRVIGHWWDRNEQFWNFELSLNWV